MVDYPDPKPLPTAGNDKFTGTSSDDVLSGYDGNDSISGGNGDDLFMEGKHLWVTSGGIFKKGTTYDLGKGNDTFDGGAGFDGLSYLGTSAAAVLDLTVGTVTRGSEVDAFRNIEAFELGDGADSVVGLGTGFVFFTQGGNDTVRGALSSSYIDGGAGNDLLDLSGMATSVSVNLGSGAASAGSTLVGFERVIGAAGATNQLYGSSGNETLTGGSIQDTIYGGGGNDSLVGKGGNDVINGYGGIDSIYGGDGNDTISVDTSDVVVSGGGGSDLLDLYGLTAAVTLDMATGVSGTKSYTDFENVKGAHSYSNVLTGTSGANTLSGGSKGDTLFGGAGNDSLTGNGGKDSISGGDGNDTISGDEGKVDGGIGADVIYHKSWGSINVQGGDGSDQLFIRDGGVVTVDGGTGNDQITVETESAANSMDLSGKISGGDGTDTFLIGRIVSLGTTSIFGGNGNDTVVIEDTYSSPIWFYGDSGTIVATIRDSRNVHVAGGTGADLVSTSGDADLYATLVGGDDTLTALDRDSSSSWFVEMGDGNDLVEGMVNGEVYGGLGNDTISGEIGAIYGGDGSDVVFITNEKEFAYLRDEDDIYGGAGVDTVTLGAGHYAIYTADATGSQTSLADVFGFETINIADGAVEILDLRGLDLSLGDKNDTLTASVSGHSYHLDAGADIGAVNASGTTIFGDDGADTLFGGADLTASLYGGGGADAVVVIAMHGLVDLGAGADNLEISYDSFAKTSNDLLVTTGTGADQLVFQPARGTVEITDFDPTIDKLQVFGVAKLSDFDSATEAGGAVTLVEQGLTLILDGVSLSDLAGTAIVPL